jgi:hypothetical protein
MKSKLSKIVFAATTVFLMTAILISLPILAIGVGLLVAVVTSHFLLGIVVLSLGLMFTLKSVMVALVVSGLALSILLYRKFSATEAIGIVCKEPSAS